MTEQVQARPGTVARGTLARFTSEASGAAFGLLTGSVTARNLGPAGKGTLSTLTYLVALVAPLCAFGLGEASLTVLGRAKATLQQAVSATITALLTTTVLGMGVVVLVVRSQFSGAIPGLQTAVLATAASLPVITFVTVVGMLVESAQQVVFVSAVRAGIAASTAALTVVFVLMLHRAITGALVAIVLGWSLGLGVLLVRLLQLGVAPVPGWDGEFLRTAIRLGIPTQMSYLVIVASARIDLLFVRRLAGRAAAGQYSVALTVGQLVTYASVALAVAGFPTLTRLDVSEARLFVRRLCGTAVAAALLSAAALAVIAPVLMPLAFGDGFRPAVQPALILLPGGVLWGAQWVACRAAAARGQPGILLTSFAAGLAAMVLVDLALVPRLGPSGAAVGSDAASLVGLLAAVLLRRDSVIPSLRGFVPRVTDVSHVLVTLRRFVRQPR